MIRKNKSKIYLCLTMISSIILSFQSTVYAGDIASSSLAKGLQKLLEDLSKYALIIAPIATVLVVVYYNIRKSMADEMEHRQWDTRIKVAIVACIFAVGASALINVLMGYFK